MLTLVNEGFNLFHFHLFSIIKFFSAAVRFSHQKLVGSFKLSTGSKNKRLWVRIPGSKPPVVYKSRISVAQDDDVDRVSNRKTTSLVVSCRA